jgi:hypothetical protein
MYKCALLIWLKTVLLNAVFISIGAMVSNGFETIIVLPVIFIAGGFITVPLVFVVAWLIKKYISMNYHPTDKFYWLMFSVVVMGVGFLLLLFVVIQIDLWPMDRYTKLLITSIIISATLAVRFTKSSLTCLNIIYHEKLMV